METSSRPDHPIHRARARYLEGSGGVVTRVPTLKAERSDWSIERAAAAPFPSFIPLLPRCSLHLPPSCSLPLVRACVLPSLNRANNEDVRSLACDRALGSSIGVGGVVPVVEHARRSYGPPTRSCERRGVWLRRPGRRRTHDVQWHRVPNHDHVAGSLASGVAADAGRRSVHHLVLVVGRRQRAAARRLVRRGVLLRRTEQLPDDDGHLQQRHGRDRVGQQLPQHPRLHRRPGHVVQHAAHATRHHCAKVDVGLVVVHRWTELGLLLGPVLALWQEHLPIARWQRASRLGLEQLGRYQHPAVVLGMYVSHLIDSSSATSRIRSHQPRGACVCACVCAVRHIS